MLSYRLGTVNDFHIRQHKMQVRGEFLRPPHGTDKHPR